jgi:glyceraldehyde 3-phosphate dehydrogenase
MTNRKMNILINGLGRIGKSLLRQILSEPDFVNEIRLNATPNNKQIALMLKYDSHHGIFTPIIDHDDNHLYCNGKKITISHNRTIEETNLSNIDLVFECTGSFNSKIQAQKYIKGGASRVLISAPCDDADKTIVFGVNHKELKTSDLIISAGSCTTNCITPICKILHSKVGIEKGYMTTIHSYTNDQRVLDGNHKDPRRARSCAVSIIPTSTGAAKSIELIIPELSEKIDGSAIRVPTPNVSLIDFTFLASQDISPIEINHIFTDASLSGYKDILSVASEQLVSIDFNGNTHSAIIDPFETRVTDNNLVRVLAWYDNETAFAARMLDIAKYINHGN